MDKQNSSSRIASALIGTLLVLCALGIFFTVPGSNIAGLLAGAVILLLGIEAWVSAARGRPCLLSRLGPLP